MDKVSKIENRIALDILKEKNTKENRDKLIEMFHGLGVEIKGEKGLVDLNWKREKNFCQYFTPLWVSDFIRDILNIQKNTTVFDNSCGSGRLLYSMPNKELCFGVEKEDVAYSVAKYCLPQANIVKGDLLDYIWDHKAFDVSVINPPFGMWLTDKKCRFYNNGYRGRILSQVAAIESAARCSRYGFAAILPSNFLDYEDDYSDPRKIQTRKLHRHMNYDLAYKLVGKIKLPKDCFTDLKWDISIFVFFRGYYGWIKPFETKLKFDTVEKVVSDFKSQKFYEYYLDKFDCGSSVLPDLPKHIREKKVKKVFFRKEFDVDHSDENEVTIINRGRNIYAKCNSDYSQMLIEQCKANILDSVCNGHYYSVDSVEKKIGYADRFKLDKIWSENLEIKDTEFVSNLLSKNANVKIDLQLKRWIKKKKKDYEIQSATIPQWVENDGIWTEIKNKQSIDKVRPDLYIHKVNEFLNLAKKYSWMKSLYGFQKKDLIHLSVKKSAIISFKQGLGKTRTSVALCLLSNTKKNLIVVPSRLLQEWKIEFNNLGLEFNVIKNEQDARSELGLFNLITFSVIKKAVKNKSKRKIFIADILSKRISTLILDEAHFIKNCTTVQSKSVRRLKPKRRYYLTATPIDNLVQDMYFVLESLYGKETPYFPYNTRSFKDDFITLEWVDRMYEDTLSKGRTSQKVPKISNPDKLVELLSSKIVRRVHYEPEVIADIPYKKPIIIEKPITPCTEHMEIYHDFLLKFSQMFETYLSEEDSRTKSVTAAMILQQLGVLQFASQLPQCEKILELRDHNLAYTTKQLEICDLIYQNKDKYIVLFSVRPDFCVMVGEILDKAGIKSNVFIGKKTIKQRDKMVRQFRSGEVKILLASINVADTGLNLPQGEIAIMCDPDWKWSKMEQAYHRLIRPQTKKSPEVYFMYNEGTIEEYMWQHAKHKKSASSEVIDGQEFDDSLEWSHWKDIIINMLKDKGLLGKDVA